MVTHKKSTQMKIGVQSERFAPTHSYSKQLVLVNHKPKDVPRGRTDLSSLDLVEVQFQPQLPGAREQKAKTPQKGAPDQVGV